MPKLTDTESRQWKNRAIDAERELAAIKRRFSRLLDKSFLAIIATKTGPLSTLMTIETIRCDAPHGKVRDANFLDRIQAAIHHNIREVEDGSVCRGYTCALDEDDMREYCSRGGCLYYRRPSKSRKQSTLVRFTKETKND